MSNLDCGCTSQCWKIGGCQLCERSRSAINPERSRTPISDDLLGEMLERKPSCIPYFIHPEGF